MVMRWQDARSSILKYPPGKGVIVDSRRHRFVRCAAPGCEAQEMGLPRVLALARWRLRGGLEVAGDAQRRKGP